MEVQRSFPHVRKKYIMIDDTEKSIDFQVIHNY